MIDITKILQERQCVLSVIGPHAGESMSQIYERKIQDIANVGKTFWITSCGKFIFEKINDLCITNDLYIIFIAPSSPNGARPATTETAASGYTINGVFSPFPEEMSPVTGNINRKTAALVFDELQLLDENNASELDLWNYMDAVTLNPIRFALGSSTKPCLLNTESEKSGMKSRYRKISAVGHFTPPFCFRPVK